MALFNLEKTISLSNLQNNIFLDGSPICDIVLQKGIRYTFSLDETVDRCLWVSYNKEDTDIKKTIPGNRIVSLVDTIESSKENCLFVKYSPHVLCSFADIVIGDESVSNWDTEVIERLENIPIRDFVSGKYIVGETSGANAKIVSFSTSCDSTICLNYDIVSGDFIHGEMLTIQGIDSESILSKMVSDASIFDHIYDYRDVLSSISATPYINGSIGDYEKAICYEFKKAQTFPFESRITFDSFSRKVKEQMGCLEETRELITLQYSPNLLCHYSNKLVCDWDENTIQKLEKFPYFDFLKGHIIRGWHSSASAEVDKVTVKYKSGNRYIIAKLKNATDDFLPNEPIEITSKPQEEIWQAWNSVSSEYTDVDGLYDILKEYLRKPFFTASSIDNAICNGMLDEYVSDASKKVSISMNGCAIDKEHFKISVSSMSDYYRSCQDKCTFYPEDSLVYDLEFSPEIEIGSEIRIKIDTVEYVENNGSNKSIIIEVPPEARDKRIYLSDAEYTLVPIEFSIIDQSMNSRAFSMDDIISEGIACEYPEFVEFMKMHFSYSHSIGNGKYFLNNSSNTSSLDCIPYDLLDEIAKETLGPIWCEKNCEKELYKYRSLQKEFNTFWNYNGTTDGIKYLFNIMCWPEPTICSPCERVLKVSGDDFIKKEYIYGMNSINTICPHDKTLICDWDNVLIDDVVFYSELNPFEGFEGYDIRGLRSRATATLERADIIEDKNGYSITVLEISHRTGEFIENEKIEIRQANNTTFFEYGISSSVVYGIPHFIENLRNFGTSLSLIGNILTGIDVESSVGEFCPFETLLIEEGCQNGNVYVECVSDDGEVLTIVSDNAPYPNTGYTNGESINIKKINSIGDEVGHVSAKAITGVIHKSGGEYNTKTSLTDNIVVMNDNCLTDPNAYIISVPMNRKEYIKIYDDMVREAGTLAYSEYPISDTLKNISDTKVTSYLEIVSLP